MLLIYPQKVQNNSYYKRPFVFSRIIFINSVKYNNTGVNCFTPDQASRLIFEYRLFFLAYFNSSERENIAKIICGESASKLILKEVYLKVDTNFRNWKSRSIKNMRISWQT